MSEQKPPNPGRRRFFGEILSNLGREAGLLAREAQIAARDIDRALADAGEEIQAVAVETPIHTDLDGSELAERLDAIDAELSELDGQVQQLVEAAAQPQPLAEEDRELLRRVAELLAARHTELAEGPFSTAASGSEPEADGDDEAAVLRRRRKALRDWTWKLITALFGIRLFDALYETFVSNELVPWAAEQWRGIFAQAEAAGVIDQSPLSSPLPSPTTESPSPIETSTPKPETPTPPRRPSTGSGQDTRRTGRIPVPELVTVPAGHFWMGSDRRIDKDARDDELPQHRLYLPGYRIGKYPVTNEEYAAFLAATGHRKPGDWEANRSKLDHPVANVSWLDATAYCRWLSEATGRVYRLPSEAEWEKAARGSDGRIYPWGNQPPDARRCNFNENVKDTTPVGSYPAGVSPYGCYDMAGNVWEWTSSRWGSEFGYPYRGDGGRENLESEGPRVLRGGSWWSKPEWVRCAYRSRLYPWYGDNNRGYRLASGLSR
jgi:formylglycine-generating enzyme required for sulfatase activity